MPLLVRKINLTSWALDSNVLEVEEMSADSITSLQTTANKLSTWEIESEDKVGEVVLALTSGFKSPATVHVTWVDKQLVFDEGFEVADDKGNSKVNDLNHCHRNIINLNYRLIGRLASLFAESLRNNQFKTFSRIDVLDILISAIKKDRLERKKLSEDLLRQIDVHLANQQAR